MADPTQPEPQKIDPTRYKGIILLIYPPNPPICCNGIGTRSPNDVIVKRVDKLVR